MDINAHCSEQELTFSIFMIYSIAEAWRKRGGRLMKVHHGSTEIIEKPDVNQSKRYLDFGRGFYLKHRMR